METFVLSLTAPASHAVTIPAAQGTLSIGPAVPGAARPDVVVDPDEVLDWSTFDQFTVPSGYPWPRSVRYHGSDTSLFDWSVARQVERFDWTPTAALTVDASAADIVHLSVTLRDVTVSMTLPARVRTFTVSGAVTLLQPDLAPAGTCPALFVYPSTRASRSAGPLPLPPLPALRGTSSIYVGVKPMRQAFDCASLLQFPDLTEVRLFGQLTNLEVLERLTGLERLQVGDCPDLSGLPPLATWPDLRRFDASNIIRETGQDLRQQLKRHRIPQASVTGLRTVEWFEKDYGLPFSAWPPTTARRAIAAFRAAEAAGDPETGIREFVRAINGLPDLDTIQREDAAEAVAMLAARAKIDEDVALGWFDDERDF